MTTDLARRAPISASVDIKAQFHAVHNPSFPFSSPSIDDHRSLDSAQFQSTLESPDLSPESNERGNKSEQHVLHMGRHNQDTNTISTEAHMKKSTPGLHLITDFSKPISHTVNCVYDQVLSKQAGQSRHRARSVKSQKGVKLNALPTPGKQSTSIDTRDLHRLRREKRQAYLPSPQDAVRPNQYSPARKSVVIGLCVSEHEAAVHNQNEVSYSAVTLITPATPAIVLTPPDTGFNASKVDKPSASSRRPTSSMYSTVTIQHKSQSDERRAPPMPSISQYQTTGPVVLQKENPFWNVPKPQVVRHYSEDQRQFPEGSRDRTLSSSAETLRPKSQGWWNVLLSPMLSRASSSASKRGREFDEDTPPVPPIPTIAETETPAFETSPETPRRLGLANSRVSTWSRWTEWEEERNEAQASQPETFFRDKLDNEIPVNLVQTEEGLAAEYYHACAIEQLTGITYFDCINHSCAQGLPKLISTSKQSDGGTIVLGSPFPGTNENGIVFVALRDSEDKRNKEEYSDDEYDHTTPIDSDDESIDTPLIVKRVPPSKKETLTPIQGDLEPDDLSPNIRKANTAAVVRARALETSSKAPTPLPLYTRTVGIQDMPNIAAVASQHHILSPQPLSPEGHRTTAPAGALPMSSYQQKAQPDQPLATDQTSYANLPFRPDTAPITITQLRPEQRTRESIEARRYHNEKEDIRARKLGGLWRGRGCVPKSGCFGRGGREGRSKRRWLFGIAAFLILIIVLCIVLATQLTRKGTGTPVQSQWLNLTGYPPIPTGISTVARPALAASENRCAQITTMWSCALPKEDQADIAPNDSNQPNFRFQITFRNGTVPANMTVPITKRANDPFTNDLFVPNPTPPSESDQLFLGNTTDNVSEPFDGEQTPFFITFMSSSPVLPAAYNASQKIATRDLTNNIPGPALSADGTAAPASLLPTTPYPISQPVKLFNRGSPEEHYGFYMYYDKSIFLSGVAITNSTASNKTAIDQNADQNGGSTKQQATVRCTFSQTRFLVKMFTSSRFQGSLLDKIGNTTIDVSKQSTNSSATNFNRPGSFPYPTTVILDRHGGSLNTKLLYCYGMENGRINVNEKQLAFEDRSFGGTPVNPAPSLINDGTNTGFDSSEGIDGGTGGCGCTWQNWK